MSSVTKPFKYFAAAFVVSQGLLYLWMKSSETSKFKSRQEIQQNLGRELIEIKSRASR